MPNPRGINQYTKGGGGKSKSKRKGPPKASPAMQAKAKAWKPQTSSQLNARSNRNAMRRGELTKWK